MRWEPPQQGLPQRLRQEKESQKRKKKTIAVVAVILVLAVIACGALYYYDITPFNFELGSSYGFKYYKNAVKKGRFNR